MTTEAIPVAPDALHRELTQERIQSARRINLVRFWGVSAFFALFALGGFDFRSDNFARLDITGPSRAGCSLGLSN